MEKAITEFKTYLDDLNKRLQLNEEAKKLYYGFYILDGPIIKNPKVLFIGLNPGKGSAKRKYAVELHDENYIDRISYLDKYSEDYDYFYHLAETTASIFEAAGKSKDEIVDLFENHSVKTNFYPIITDDGNDIKKCVAQLGQTEWKKFYQECCKFCVELIREIKPEVVIFEGKVPYDFIVKDCFGITKSWTDQGIGYYFSDEFNTHFLGYTRTYSSIPNNAKTALAEKLSTLI